MSNSRLLQFALIPVFSALALTGCQRDSHNSNTENTGPDSATPTAKLAPAPGIGEIRSQDNAGERTLNLSEIEGGWRVVASSTKGSPVIGAIAEIYPESLSWSYRPDGATGLDQLCQEPVLGNFHEERSERENRAMTKAIAGPRADLAVAPPHEVLCAKGGAWGPDAGSDVVLLDDGKLLMTWNDGQRLELERLVRPEAKAEMESEDYKADSAK